MKNKITIERRKKAGVLVPKLNGEILEGVKNINISYSYGETEEKKRNCWINFWKFWNRNYWCRLISLSISFKISFSDISIKVLWITKALIN